MRWIIQIKCMLLLLLCGASLSFAAGPSLTVDLLKLGNQEGALRRIHGADNNGSAGVPVFGGSDVDGDGHVDYGLGFFQSSPLGRSNAGSLALVFGDGELGGAVNTAGFSTNVLKVAGRLANEFAGSEAWLDDVTGDGFGDLLICRQAATYAGRNACGALTIIFGGAELRAHAASLAWLDLANLPTNITSLTIHGAAVQDRLGIWVRTGDVTGDGTNDVVVGADQVNTQGDNAGAVFVIRGGSHLYTNLLVDAATYSSSPIGDHVMHFLPPSGSAKYHLGATLNVGDLNNDGFAEVVAAATINRAGAQKGSGGEANSGAPRGKMYIAWGQNFNATHWTNGYSFVIDSAPEGYTGIQGGSTMLRSDGVAIANSFNDKFGEELLIGKDYDGDGAGDLFVGDITARSKNRANSGAGWVFFDVFDTLFNEDFVLNDFASFPSNLSYTVIHGPRNTAISSDTANHGDFNGDGIDDLFIGNPCDDPPGRSGAGTMHVIYGQTNVWPMEIDLAPGALPSPSTMRIVEILGVKADDILCYSTCDGDVDGDGFSDLMVNEMQGDNPFNGQNNVGTLLIIGGRQFSEASDVRVTQATIENPLSSSTFVLHSVVVTNAGPALASNVVVQESLPVGQLEVVPGFLVGVGSVSGANPAVWTIPSLGVGAAVTATYFSAVNPASPLVLTSRVEAVFSALDVEPVNNTDGLVLMLLDSDTDLVANLFDDDDDGDEIPDVWEMAYGLNSTNPADAVVDGDLDGHSALQEFIADTLPNNSSSVFEVAIATNVFGVYAVSWNSSSNRVYDVFCSTNLMTNSWTQISTNTLGTGGAFVFPATNVGERAYYRVEVKL